MFSQWVRSDIERVGHTAHGTIAGRGRGAKMNTKTFAAEGPDGAMNVKSD